jgi:hypothetical protein
LLRHEFDRRPTKMSTSSLGPNWTGARVLADEVSL